MGRSPPPPLLVLVLNSFGASPSMLSPSVIKGAALRLSVGLGIGLSNLSRHSAAVVDAVSVLLRPGADTNALRSMSGRRIRVDNSRRQVHSRPASPARWG